MARLGSFRHGGRPSAPRRQTEWIAGITGLIDFTASESKVLISFSQAMLRDFVPCTLIRTVGTLVVAADTNFITNQIYAGAVGGVTVRDDARASGVFPDPIVNDGDDTWFYH